MLCGQTVGIWQDDAPPITASCWEDLGHAGQCCDPQHQLRWTPGDGRDSTGRLLLVDPDTAERDARVVAVLDAFLAAPPPARDTRPRRRARSRP